MDREYVCKNAACPFRMDYEAEAPTMTADPGGPVCECGVPMEICIYPLKSIWVGTIGAHYNDPGLADSHKEGHFVYGKDPVTGKPERQFVDTWSKQREVCKRYGYVNPKDMPRNFTPTEDGKGVTNTRGMPGTEL